MKKIFLLTVLLVVGISSFLSAEIMEEEKHPVAILGGGVAALTSATYLARAGITPLVIIGPVVGGTITQSNEVQNWPGEIAISGEALSEKIFKQAEFNGALLRSEEVVSVDFSQRPFVIVTKKLFSDGSEDLKRYKVDSCIIALGATPNLLKVAGESKYWTRGVYTCAVCDGSLYNDKVVAVVGGGDSALIEAQYLSNIAKKVYLIVRADRMRSVENKRAQEILSRANIEVLFETTVQEIKGEDEQLTHLILKNKGKKQMSELPVDALFLAIGAQPNTELFREQLELDEKNYIVLKKYQQTSVEGVYAMGDVADPEFKQAISAAGDGAKAALQAQKFLSFASTAQPTVRVAQPSTISSASPVRSLIKVNDRTAIDNKPIEITSREQFEKEVKESSGPIFIDFYSTRCPPCRSFAPLYEGWAQQFHGKIKFLKVNADVVSELFNQYRISAVPTLLILDSKGNIIRKNVGMGEISKLGKFLGKFRDGKEIAAQDFR